jgi:hypothetical protein
MFHINLPTMSPPSTPRPFRVNHGTTEYIIIAGTDDLEDSGGYIMDIFMFHHKRVLGERVTLNNLPEHLQEQVREILRNPLL